MPFSETFGQEFSKSSIKIGLGAGVSSGYYMDGLVWYIQLDIRKKYGKTILGLTLILASGIIARKGLVMEETNTITQ